VKARAFQSPSKTEQLIINTAKGKECLSCPWKHNNGIMLLKIKQLIVIENKHLSVLFATSALCFFLMDIHGIEKKTAQNAPDEINILCREDLSTLSFAFVQEFISIQDAPKISIRTFKEKKGFSQLRAELPYSIIINDNIADNGKFFIPSSSEYKMLALQGAAFIVNGANPVSSVGSEKIKSILEGKTIGWGELGGSNSLINLYIYEKDNESLLRIIRAAIPEMGQFSEKALKVSDQKNMKFIVSADLDGFGIINFSNLQDGLELRILKVNGIFPSYSGMSVRKYPFSRTIYISISDKPSAGTAKLVEFIMGRHGREIIAKNKMFPLNR